MLKTLLLTDIVNSTQLTQTIGDERMSEIWIEHDQIARKLLSEHHGQEADRTDGFLMLFDSAFNASCYALDLHRAFSNLSEKWNIDFKARIGIHTGDIILIETSEEHRATGVKHIEVEGLAKPLAARVMSLASGGQTLLSKDSHDSLILQETPPLKTSSHGHWHLKGVEEPIELFEIGNEQTHFHPPADTEKVFRVVMDNGVWIPVKKIPNNLVKEADSFVGRKKELNHLAELIREEHTQLVTILGPGGTGKTRLSKRFARIWIGDYPGGTWFCDLAESRTLEGIAVAIAASFGTQLSVGDPIQQLAYVIEAKNECLIILDNFEQITEFAEATLGEWMLKTPNAKFIVTSRNSLHLPGEKTFDLAPLPVETDAITLFVSRAKDRKRNFEINDKNRDDIESIVNQLDGMPLAIELAAARVSILKPKQIKERLKDRFKLLSGSKGATQRQRTLEATIDWSWDLLEEWEKSALAQCSVFDGGFTLEAAEEVIDLSEFEDAPMTMDVIQALVDKSLLRSEVQRYDIDEPWYGMYVSISHYCKKKLNKEGEFKGSGLEGSKSCSLRHAQYYAGFGSDEAINEILTGGDYDKADILLLELDNLVKASQFVVKNRHSSLATCLVRGIFQIVRKTGPTSAIVPIAEVALQIPDIDKRDQLRIYIVLLEYAAYAFDKEVMDKYSRYAIEVSQKIGDREREGEVYRQNGRLCINIHDYDTALVMTQKAIEIAEEFPQWKGGIESYQLAGELAKSAPQETYKYEDAPKYFEQAIAKADELGYDEWKAGVMNSYGTYFKEAGKFEESIKFCSEALAITRLIKNKLYEGATCCNIGTIYFEMGDFDNALNTLNNGISILKEVGARTFSGFALFQLARVFMAQNKFDEGKSKYEEAGAIFSEDGNLQFEAYTIGSIGFGEMMIQDNLMAAREYIERALEKAKDSKNDELIINLECLLAEISAKEGSYELSNKEFKSYDERLVELKLDESRAFLMISWARAACSNLDMSTAREKLNVAIAITDSLGLLKQSELRRSIDAVSEMIE